VLRTAADTETLQTIKHLGENFKIRGRRLHENLYLYAAIPEAAVLTSTHRIALIALAFVLGSIIITTALLYGFLRSLLLNPLARIEQAAREVGLGGRVTDIGIHRNDEVGQLAASFEEMSRNLQCSREQITHIAHHDHLTGLPNRHMITQVLERALVNARQNDEILGLLFLDLDNFKRVNDSLGHLAGDTLLREIAVRLTAVVRPEDYVVRQGSQETHSAVARLGGDEFIVLLPRLEKTLNAGAVARRTLDALALPILIEDNALEVSASIGIAVFPEDGRTASELIKCADIAMYHAKEHGKNHFQFYTRALNIALMDRIETERGLRKALLNDEFVLHYQPQVDALSGEIIGTEALLRWEHPERGQVMPGDFISTAEDSGLILPIGEWVLREACRQNKAWQNAGLKAVPVAVNVSARQFSSAELEDSVRRVLAETGLSSQYLGIELTETCVMERPEQAAATLTALSLLGIQVSLDDFGTGYSSLGSLKRMPIDMLKIDQSFVRDITTDNNDTAIIIAIIAMGHSLGLRIIAEGVDQVDQLRFLRANGCDQIQGFLISRPIPADSMAVLLATAPSPLPVLEADCSHQAPRRAQSEF